MARRYRKKAKKRKRKRRSTRMTKRLQGSGLAFPSNRIVKMRYCEAIQLDPSAGTVAKYVFKANDINDPNQTGAGHQPKGHDEWAQFYNHQIVLGSKITAQFTGQSTNQYGSVFGVGLMPSTGGLGSTPQDICENDTADWTVCGLSSNSGENYHANRAYYSAKEFFNIEDVKDNVTRLGASFGTTPDELAYYEVFIGALDATINPGATDILVTIEYTVLCSEPKVLSAS